MRPLGPGGALLRSSRLFSLPPPISPPPTLARSATATTGYPTRQTVTTPPKSRKVGDWGFKHPLPLKSTTASSTPYIRVSQVSAPESVTYFRSAADHTLSLEKFTEMKIAMVQPRSMSHRSYPAFQQEPARSVFEDQHDFTFVDPSKGDWQKQVNNRWKFTGPWLAGMTSGGFERYLHKKVREPKQRLRFRIFLRQMLVRRLNEELVRTNIDQGIQTESGALLQPHDVTEDQMLDYLRELRADVPQMHRLMCTFLDLAPMKPSDSSRGVNSDFSSSPYAEAGPPRTHPSAGISYLRTSSFMENHPLHGPQLHHAPVAARVVTPGRGTGDGRPVIGVGGFIARADDPNLRLRNSLGAQAGLWGFDRNSKGGVKVWTQVQTASVAPSGKVMISATKAADDEALVARELRGERVELERQRKAAMRMSTYIDRPKMPQTSGFKWLGNRRTSSF